MLLDWGLTRDQAMGLERFLFENLVTNDKYGTVEERYYPSAKNADDQAVYLAWWSPYLVWTEE